MRWLFEIWEAIRPHIAGIGLIVTWSGIALVAWRRRASWRRKHFGNVVNFSLNYVADNKLIMRTLIETSATTVWLNEYGVKLVLQAAARTRDDQPFIVLKDPADMRFIQRAALNVLSARFPEVFLGAALGASVRRATFVFAVTFENYRDMRTRKFRVLLIEENALQQCFGPGTPDPEVVEETHKDRIRALRSMYMLTQKPLPEANGAQVLGKIELGVLA